MGSKLLKRSASTLKLAEQGLTAAVAAWLFLGLVRPRRAESSATAPAVAGEDADVRSPMAISGRGWLDIGWRVFRTFNASQLMFVSGGVTFFTLLAVFPAIGAFVSLYGLFFDPAKAHQEVALLYGLAPKAVVQFLSAQVDLLAQRRASTLSLAFGATILLSIWSASASIKALIYGLNIAYHETEKRNFLRYTALTLAFTVAGLAFVLFTSALVVAVPVVETWFGWAWNRTVVGWIRWPSLFFGYVAMLSVLYRYGPCREPPRWRWLTVGGLFAATGNLLISLLFSWYVGSIAHYDATYGPLGAIVGFMVWTWWSFTVILVGAALNAELERRAAPDDDS